MADLFEEVMATHKVNYGMENSIPEDQLRDLTTTITMQINLPQSEPPKVLQNAIFPKTLKQEKIIYKKPAHIISNKPSVV